MSVKVDLLFVQNRLFLLNSMEKLYRFTVDTDNDRYAALLVLDWITAISKYSLEADRRLADNPRIREAAEMIGREMREQGMSATKMIAKMRELSLAIDQFSDLLEAHLEITEETVN